MRHEMVQENRDQAERREWRREWRVEGEGRGRRPRKMKDSADHCILGWTVLAWTVSEQGTVTPAIICPLPCSHCELSAVHCLPSLFLSVLFS